MLEPMYRSSAVGWHFVKNQFAERTTNEQSTSKPKPAKTIRRRTRILNKELKKFAKMKSYSQYVKIKKKILREVSDDDFVEEESFENDRVAVIRSPRESISGPGPSREKPSSTSKESSKTKQKNDHNHKTKNNGGEQNFSRAKRNLSGILENLDIGNLLEDKSETVDEVNGDVGNNGASRQVTRKSRIPMANVPLGDSGIDDNSQANSLSSNHENNDDAEGINTTEMADKIAEESNDLSNTTFTQAETTASSKDKSEEFDSNQDRARKFSQPAENDDKIEEYSDEEENVEGLTVTEKNDNKVKECASTNKKIENSSQSDINDDKMETILAEGRAEMFPQSDVDDVEEYATTKATVEKNSVSDVDSDEIEESLAMEKKVEKSLQSDENKKSSRTEKRIEELSQSDENEESSTNEKRIEELSQSHENEESSKTEERIEESSQSGGEREGEIEEVSTKKESVKNTFNDTRDDPIEESWAKDERTEICPQPDMDDDSFKKKNQLTITCTEIVTSKYTIIRDENEKEEDLKNHSPEFEIVENNEPTEFDETSSEADRVGKLKRINLLCSGTESESSEEDENLEQTIVEKSAHPALSSQMISDPSDSEDSDSLALHITDSEDGKVTSTPYCKQQTTEISRSGLVKKSIMDQIKEQSIIDSPVRVEEKSVNNAEEEEQVDYAENEGIASPEKQQSEVSEIMNDTPKKKNKKKQQLYETESLQYVLKNISKRNCNDENLVEPCLQNNEDNLPRPTELHDFVAREELIPTNTSSTITLEDISKINKREDDDEEIWFMEIPKSIVTDPGLCGRSIVIQKNQITIGNTNYNVTRKHTKAVSCILRKNKKKTRYKTVNIRPVLSINVRHERTESAAFIPSKASPPEKSVPFPKNIKSRNPLIVEKKGGVSSSESSYRIVDKEKTKRESTKKRKHGVWHMDNFILKRRRKKIDGCWINGSKNADLFNE